MDKFKAKTNADVGFYVFEKYSSRLIKNLGV